MEKHSPRHMFPAVHLQSAGAGGPWGQGAGSDTDPHPNWAFWGGVLSESGAEFQGTATLALPAFYSHLFCWPLGASRPPTSGILALTFSCSVPRWPPNPSRSCSSPLSCHCPLCPRPPSLLPLPPPKPSLRTVPQSPLSPGLCTTGGNTSGPGGAQETIRYFCQRPGSGALKALERAHPGLSFSADFPQASRGPSRLPQQLSPSPPPQDWSFDCVRSLSSLLAMTCPQTELLCPHRYFCHSRGTQLRPPEKVIPADLEVSDLATQAGDRRCLGQINLCICLSSPCPHSRGKSGLGTNLAAPRLPCLPSLEAQSGTQSCSAPWPETLSLLCAPGPCLSSGRTGTRSLRSQVGHENEHTKDKHMNHLSREYFPSLSQYIPDCWGPAMVKYRGWLLKDPAALPGYRAHPSLSEFSVLLCTEALSHPLRMIFLCKDCFISFHRHGLEQPWFFMSRVGFNAGAPQISQGINFTAPAP